MKTKNLLLFFLALWAACGVCSAQIDLTGKSPEEIARLRAIFKRMDELRSQMSPAHKGILFEDFSKTGVRFQDIEVVRQQDYQKSSDDKSAIEKEINHYLSQLGVSWVSLSRATGYEVGGAELLGALEINVLYPEKKFEDYYAYLLGALSPFESTEGKPSGLMEDIAAAVSSMYVITGSKTAMQEVKDSVTNSLMEIQNREHKTYRFAYSKGGYNYRVELVEAPTGYSLNLSGLSSLEEYIASSVTSTSNSNLKEAVPSGSTALPEKYTIWVKDSAYWYVCVRDGQTAVFLKLALKSNGDMDYNNGTGLCFKSGQKYPYTNGSWGKPSALSSAQLSSEISNAQRDYILSPSGNMSGDKVKLNQSSAYFDDLDIYLP